MFEAADFRRLLDKHGVVFYAGVPDTVIKNFCNHVVENPPPGGQAIAANEGGAIGLAAGQYLATGRIPVVYMQNSGLGNAVNPLLSMADREVYAIPMLLLIGWRGEPGLKDEPQHVKQGRVSTAMLDAMEIPWGVVEPDLDKAAAAVDAAFAAMAEKPGPYALLVRNGCFAPVPPVEAGFADSGLTRENAIRLVVESLRPDTAYVASTGMGSRELYEIRESLDQPHGSDFLNVGAMGHASQIAAGIALSRPGRPVVCLDGDGALLMHLGGLALIPSLGCNNLVHILLNNGVHDSVGGQPTLTATLDAAALAELCGYRRVFTTNDAEELKTILAECQRGDGPVFVEIVLKRGFRKDLGRPGIPFVEATRQFRNFMDTE